ncbi:hypothetical protein DWB84_01380 [Saccharophagus sp. K07]|nr:hypothetical protein [Saccharophagus sp. K07]
MARGFWNQFAGLSISALVENWLGLQHPYCVCRRLCLVFVALSPAGSAMDFELIGVFLADAPFALSHHRGYGVNARCYAFLVAASGCFIEKV